MSLYMIFEEDGKARVVDYMGYSASIDEVRHIMEICARVLDTETMETLLAADKMHTALNYPSMYPQLYTDEPPIDIKRQLKHTSKLPRAKQAGFIYLLRADNGAYKIGKTTDLKSRIKALQTQLPYVTELVHTIATQDITSLEMELHQRFADKRANGEWFWLLDDDVTYISQLVVKN